MENSLITLSIFVLNLIVAGAVGAFAASHKIGEYKAKVDRVIQDQKDCDTKRVDMKSELDKLLEFKTTTQKFIDNEIYKNRSPLSLTEQGESLVSDSGFRKVFADVKDDLVARLEKLEPKNQYETQEKARALMDDLKEYPAFGPIQQYAFDHGHDFGQILRAGAILLRDYYFKSHPEVVDPKEKW